MTILTRRQVYRLYRVIGCSAIEAYREMVGEFQNVERNPKEEQGVICTGIAKSLLDKGERKPFKII